MSAQEMAAVEKKAGDIRRGKEVLEAFVRCSMAFIGRM
jgi:hypothetical protein